MAEQTESRSEESNSLLSSLKKKSGGAGKINAGKFDIDIQHPLHSFEHVYAEAYECSNNDTGVNDSVAIVMKDRFPVRKDVIAKGLNSEIENLMSLRTTVMAEWPDGTERYVLIFKRPEGHPMMQFTTQRREPLSEETVRRGIIRPLFHTLQKMNHLGLFHGNIRPTNLFMTSHDNAQVTLGESASSIPGILQPILYESIERGMTDIESKGIGANSDDIYSFGATIAVLMRGFNPAEGKSDRIIIEEKIMRGSYSLLTDGLRLSPGLSEFLRATLNDDPRQRWDIEQLAAWVDGNRTTPKQSSLGLKAQRHLEFNGKKYIRPRMLARDIHENPTEAVTLIESGNLAKWVERAIGDNAMVSQLNAALGRASMAGRTTGFEDRLLCYISMALDSTAPIRYKNLKIMPAGIGHALLMAMLRNENVQILGEIIRDKYAWTWLHHKENYSDKVPELLPLLDHASKMIARRGIDYGIERCLYELCPDAPCMSDMFDKHYVADCEGLLNALDKVSKSYSENKPLDRHIASFITVRDNRDNSGLMTIVDTGDVMKRSLALLTLYQLMQRRFNMNKLPGLAQWLAKEAEVVVQRFRSISLKTEILKQLPKEVATGNLTRLLGLVDNPAQVRRDESDYHRAMQQYYIYGHERDNIRKELTTNPYYGFRTGRQIALFVSMIMTALIIAATLIVHFGDKT
jgi:serine/threonine protein kinase